MIRQTDLTIEYEISANISRLLEVNNLKYSAAQYLTMVVSIFYQIACAVEVGSLCLEEKMCEQRGVESTCWYPRAAVYSGVMQEK